MVLYVLNPSIYEVEGIIDTYASCIWRPAYFEVGDFELYLGASKQLVDMLKVDHYIVRSQDIRVVNGAVSYDKVMIIKNIDLSTNAEHGDYLRVTGRELKYLLHQRIVWSQTNLSGTAESGIRQLVTENAINPTNTKRVIPNLVLGASAGLSDSIEKQITGAYLDEAIAEICATYNYGWKVVISDGDMILSVYAGVNRSFSQTSVPYVVFSDSYENLYNTDYQIETENYANTVLIGGEGEGTERIYATVGDDNSGLNRFETFSDARDLSQNKETDEEIPLADYVELLKSRGNEALADLQYTEGFSGEVLSDVAYRYGIDFDLGDVVTVINSYGISKDVRVLSAIESDDENGTKLIPEFNI